MKPAELKTRIFLDSGDPAETKAVLERLGFLDGQTTNPSLIAKNPETAGKKFGRQEILEFYKKVVQEISGLIPRGSVSIEVYADFSTSSEDMLEQGRELFTWIPNAHIKFPTTVEGLKAAATAVREGIHVNMTLCFSQDQAAAVHAATRGAKKGDVFISPFVGRLDDIGENGMDLIKNIIKMYREANSHVEVLSASLRNQDHLQQSIALGADIVTAPFKILEEWASANFPSPGDLPVRQAGGEGSRERSAGLRPIPYQQLDLNKSWTEFNIQHSLTDKGTQKFSEDWNNLIKIL